MMSNVAGPQEQSYVAGQPLDELSFQCFNAIGTYCGIVSYNGKVMIDRILGAATEPLLSRSSGLICLQVSMSVATDTLAVERPQELTKYWKEEFDRLYEDVMSFPGGDCEANMSVVLYQPLTNCAFLDVYRYSIAKALDV